MGLELGLGLKTFGTNHHRAGSSEKREPNQSPNPMEPIKIALPEDYSFCGDKGLHGLSHGKLVELTLKGHAHHVKTSKGSVLSQIEVVPFNRCLASDGSISTHSDNLKRIVADICKADAGFDYINTSFGNDVNITDPSHTSITEAQRAHIRRNATSSDIDLENAFGNRWFVGVGNNANQFILQSSLNNTGVGDDNDFNELTNRKLSNYGLKDVGVDSKVTLFAETRPSDGKLYWVVDSNQNGGLDAEDWRSEELVTDPNMRHGTGFAFGGTSYACPKALVEQIAKDLEAGTAQHTLPSGFHFETADERKARTGG